MKFVSVLIFAIVLMLPACSDDASAKQKTAEQQIAQATAIADFVTTNYEGWKIEGTSTKYGIDCSDIFPCDLHLTNANENRVLSVMIRKFKKLDDGTEYWHVWETRPIDVDKEESKAEDQFDNEPADRW